MEKLSFPKCMLFGFVTDILVTIAWAVSLFLIYVAITTSGMSNSVQMSVFGFIAVVISQSSPLLFIRIVVGNISFKGVWLLFAKVWAVSAVFTTGLYFAQFHIILGIALCAVMSGWKYNMTYKYCTKDSKSWMKPTAGSHVQYK